nr:MAG TPA: hypothetical protein [Caudoviricetes sp.]
MPWISSICVCEGGCKMCARCTIMHIRGCNLSHFVIRIVCNPRF